MSFQIFQLEKAQALDVLGRVQERLNGMLDYGVPDDNEDDSISDAIHTVFRLQSVIETKTTELDAKSLTYTELARIVEGLANRNRAAGITSKELVGYFGRYLSNYNIAVEDFELAAGQPLREDAKLMREEDAEQWEAA